MIRLLRFRRTQPHRRQARSVLKLVVTPAMLGFAAVVGLSAANRDDIRSEASAATSVVARNPATHVLTAAEDTSAPQSSDPARPNTLVVAASSLRLRSGPTVGDAIRGSAAEGTVVAWTGVRSGAWLEVRLPDGMQGWMHGNYLQKSAASAGSNRDPLGAIVEASASDKPHRDLSPFVRAGAIGRATVTDGDTIVIGGTRIRLEGLDAPESGQSCHDAGGRSYPCGGRAANALDALIARRTVSCRSEGTDRYDRMLGTCWVAAELPGNTGASGGVPAAGGIGSLNERMVAAGWALAYRRYSTAYVGVERRAQTDGRGIWQGAHTPPWDYRRGQRLMSTTAPAARASAPSSVANSSNCAIKGNISGSGRIYHVPGSRWYDRTRIDPGRGERWFCSEAEARAAGWRAPRG
ncbi:thermonuclease family protein [uncultured Jannaschia sp.]|uniref:sunset domain-containing protein n=1 Tax=uncultured Jannaschia sp. TaxID=293347 RepID=UPI002626EAED|nr:thermonuclease family protein [uncultured Jannaschia sp.]